MSSPPRDIRHRRTPVRWVLIGLLIIGFGLALIAALLDPETDISVWQEVVYGIGLGMAVASAIGWATEVACQRLAPPTPPDEMTDAEKALYYFARTARQDQP